MTRTEIEDVLASVRRLVSDEKVPVFRATQRPLILGQERLVLSPALRVAPPDAAEDAAAPPDPVPEARDGQDDDGAAAEAPEPGLTEPLSDEAPPPDLPEARADDGAAPHPPEARADEASAPGLPEAHLDEAPPPDLPEAHSDEAPAPEPRAAGSDHAPAPDLPEAAADEGPADLPESPAGLAPDPARGPAGTAAPDDRPVRSLAPAVSAIAAAVPAALAWEPEAGDSVAPFAPPRVPRLWLDGDEGATLRPDPSAARAGILTQAIGKMRHGPAIAEVPPRPAPDGPAGLGGATDPDPLAVLSAEEAAAATLHPDDMAGDAARDPDGTDPGDGDGDGDGDFGLGIDPDVLREIVRDVLREELQGALGERITRNVRKLVRAELARAIAAEAAM